ncbi:MAG: DUF5723 family protein [Crocinitomicaceae bacterium]|nr:DUF5723 family protein [Crocinitomicaceae bacterium]
MKRILLLLSLSASVTFAQNEYIAYPATGMGVSSTFVTDYHCLGVNPANLGWQAYDKKSFTTGSSEFGFSLHSQALSKQELRDNIWSAISNKTLDSLSYDDKVAAAQGFADDFAFNYDYNMFGFSYQNEKFGGIAFSIRSRATWNSSFSADFSSLLFQGKFDAYFDSLCYNNGTDTVMIGNYGEMRADSAVNVVGGQASIPLNTSELIDGSSLRLSMNREFHVGYGRKLFSIDSTFEVFAGVGARYIQGIAMMDLYSQDGEFQMYSAFSPGFDLNYADIGNPSAIPGQVQNLFRSKVGEGWGFDAGVNVTLFNNLHLAASVTNIGQMTYTGNVYEAVDTALVKFSSSGMEDVNVTNSISELIEENGILKLTGTESRTVSLPGTFRMGASLELGKYAHIGGEIVAPFNNVPGSINEFAWGLGGNFRLFGGKVHLMSGLTGGGGYDFQLPLGVNFVFGGGSYECGIASRDAVTFFTQNKPTLSTAFGFARVRF